MTDLDALLAPRIENPPKIAVLDIETLQGTLASPFFTLSDFKYRRPRPEHVAEWPRVICAAWQWYGSERINFAAEWHKGGHDGFVKRTWEVYHRADIIVGHNIDGFDTKELRKEWLLAGLPPPRPFKSVDTLKVARSLFRFESNTLDSLAHRLGHTGKSGRYDVDVARRAVAGDRDAQREMGYYNRGDIPPTRFVYDRLRPYMPNHPHIGLYTGDENGCDRCGGDLLKDGWAKTHMTAYAQYRCARCGGWLRTNYIKRRVTHRGVR